MRTAGQSLGTRICKEVKDPDVFLPFCFCLPDQVSAEIPVGCLFREKTGMLKGRRFNNECKLFAERIVIDLPG